VSSPDPGLSRRQILGRAGAVGAVLAVGGGAFGAGRLTAADHDEVTGQVAFHGPHQAGIVTPQQDHLLFATYDLLDTSRADLAKVLALWTAAAERLTAGRPVAGDLPDASPPADTGEAGELDASRLTLTFGIGAGALERVGLGSRRPPQLVDPPHFPGDALRPERSGGDLCVQACADDPQVAFHAVRNLTRIGRGIVAARWSQAGFLGKPGGGTTPRNLMGFRDGSNNLDPSDAARMDRNVWAAAGDGARWMAGGSYLVVRAIDIRIEAWDRTPLAEQESIFGRHRANGAPLGATAEHDPVDVGKAGADAHIVLANPRAAGSEDERILRRGYNMADGVDQSFGQLRAGLFFLAYQRDPRRQFVPIQTRLAQNDGLNEYIAHRGSAVFAVLPGVRPGGTLGGALLA
jgi:deferrochelatase/peroxidase EfeB